MPPGGSLLVFDVQVRRGMMETFVIVALIVVLIARELIALGHSERARRRSRVLGVIAVPLLVVFLAISVQRLILTPLPSQVATATPLATPAAAE